MGPGLPISALCLLLVHLVCALREASTPMSHLLLKPLGRLAARRISSLHQRQSLNSAVDCKQCLLESTKPKVSFVLGGPGAGKGTQCEMLSQDLGIVHLSAGELLRVEQDSGSESGRLIDSYLRDGRIVPVEVSLGLLRREIISRGQHRYLIDGFPRNDDNLQGWMRSMPDVCDIECVYFIDCDEAELERRILSRGLTSNRSDDNLDTARKRFQTFHRDSMPVVEHFRSPRAPSLVVPFEALRGAQPKDAVYRDFRQAFVAHLCRELSGPEFNAALFCTLQHQDSVAYSALCLPTTDTSLELQAFEGLASSEPAPIPQLVSCEGRTATQRYTVAGLHIERRWLLQSGAWRIQATSARS